MNVPFYAGNLIGKVVMGLHKRAGQVASVVTIEVTAVAIVPNTQGQKVPYLFGTRMDATSAGRVQMVRADCFNPNTLTISDAKGFKAIDLAGWMVTPPSNSASFAFIEKVEEPELIQWAVSLGGRPLCDYV